MVKATIVLLVAFAGWSLITGKSNAQLINFKHSAVSYNPPPYFQKAKRARYLLHNVNWGVLSTLSSHFGRDGMPFSNVIVVSDGPVDNSTGVPYFYLMDSDVSMQDAAKNSSASFTVSEMETPYCLDKGYLAEWPLCTRLTLSGKLVKVTDSEDKQFALNALFSRFPSMKDWPASHGFYPVRLNIELAWMLDYFGPGTVLNLKDYFSANPLDGDIVDKGKSI